jgi:hypothetical protein
MNWQIIDNVNSRSPLNGELSTLSTLSITFYLLIYRQPWCRTQGDVVDPGDLRLIATHLGPIRCDAVAFRWNIASACGMLLAATKWAAPFIGTVMDESDLLR